MKPRTDTVLGAILAVILRLFLIAFSLWFLYRVRSILVTVLISVMATYVALPLVDALMRIRFCGKQIKMRRFWATLVVFIALGALTVGAMRVFYEPFLQEWNRLSGNLEFYVAQAQKLIGKTAAWYGALPPDLRNLIAPNEHGSAGDLVMRWINGIIEGTVAWVTHILDVILIPVLAFYFVLDSRSLKHEFIALLPRARWKEALKLAEHASKILQTYVVGQLILCLIAGVAIWIFLWFLNMDYALVLGVLAGVTRAIPIIGPIISGIPIVLLATLKSPAIGINVLIFFVVLHFVESKFILPSLMSGRVRLHPAVIIVVLLIGGEFFGILGMFLAVPVAAVIRETMRFYLVQPKLGPTQSRAAIGTEDNFA